MASPDSGSTEEIIEKKASSPIATSCLVISCIAIVGAIFFQIWEIADYRSGLGPVSTAVKKGVGQDLAGKDIRSINDRVGAILESSAASVSGDETGGGTGLEGGAPENPGLGLPPEEPGPDDSGA